MSTRASTLTGRIMSAPSIIVLFLWMAVPLGMTIYFSFLRYNLLSPGMEEWIGTLNYEFFLTDPAFSHPLQILFCWLGRCWPSRWWVAFCWA